jgi:hypothetical protein
MYQAIAFRPMLHYEYFILPMHFISYIYTLFPL